MEGEATEIDTKVRRQQTSRSKKRKLTKQRVKTTAKMRFTVEGISPRVKKYWFQRYDLFSRYDEGIKMDEEGWFSVTPEEIAIRHAERSGGGSVIDCFSGVGGNSIQFARMCYHVVAIDIDPQKAELALNNAKIYGVEDYIDFVIGDFFQLASSLKGDVAFLSPPWGGPSYKTIEKFTLDLLKPKDGYSIFQVAQKITPNIIMFLPLNVDLLQVEELSWLSSPPLNVQLKSSQIFVAHLALVEDNIEGLSHIFTVELAAHLSPNFGGGVRVSGEELGCFMGSHNSISLRLTVHLISADMDELPHAALQVV
ncbi:hypothetical protein HHK36_025967 [Tetracentron sinense]|uniref:Trimethylguanosine synthase n=1 Tax=Tetracentron sinense TaxID=13715 RepID=A0A834YID8_TETSI|nr:hypothetical protein HHK36_025967 [Tetracentron sinense]